MANTLEFYKKSNNRVWVEFQDKDMPLETFLTLPESGRMIEKMYLEIITRYPETVKKEVSDMDIKGEVVGTFIKKYFLKKDKIYDVFLSKDGTFIKFNLEES
jgi:hypothetical protein